MAHTISFAHNVRRSLLDRMRSGPKGCRDSQRVNPLSLPPGVLVAAPVKLPMMEPADRDGEAVADLASHGSLFGKLDVVRIRRGATADETGLGGDKSQMVAVALANRLSDDGHRLSARWTR